MNRRACKGIAVEHEDVVRTLAKDRGWSKQKVKSIRGQLFSMSGFDEREKYLKNIIRSKK